MGCAFSCCQNPQPRESLDPSKTDDRSPLLAENSVTSSRPISDFGDGSASSLTKVDEQAMFNKILHKAVEGMIDVSEFEPHSMERSEYTEKMRQYLDKTVRLNLQIPKPKLLHSCTHAPMNVLLQEPPSRATLSFVFESSRAISEAITNMQVTCKQPLIVPIDVEPTTKSS